MKKRWLSTALCAAMAAGTLAGCGLKTPETTTAAPAATEAAKEETKAEEKTEAAEGETKAEAAASGKYDTANMPEVTLVYAEVNPLDTIVGQMATDFKEKVEELSDGKMTIDVQASGVLGSENDVLDTMLGGGGTIDMSRISAFALNGYGAKKSLLLSIPYTFADREHFWNFATSDLADEFLAEPVEQGLGVRGLFYGEEGFRHFFFKEEANTLEDLKGLKIRVPSNEIQSKGFDVLGATSTGMALGDVYQALQTKTIDGAENPLATLYGRKLHEVAKYLILDGHVKNFTTWVVSADWFNSLTEEQQTWLLETASEAGEYNNEVQQAAEADYLQKMKDEGVTVVEPSEEVLAGFKEKAQPFYEMDFGWTDGLYDTVRAAMGAN